MSSEKKWHQDDRRYRTFKESLEKIASDVGYFEPRHSPNAHVIYNYEYEEVINFSGYDYLSLVNHPDIREAACAALSKFGASAGASRVVSGEIQINAELDSCLAGFLGVEKAMTFVSGHGANVTTIGFLFNAHDLILHDAYVHNSIQEGIRLSGAKRWGFAHNDLQMLEKKLRQIDAGTFKRVLVVVEGTYSMDGDILDLASLASLRQKYGFILMVDEAHSLGTIGRTGRGIAEQCGVDANAVDIWFGTLSKSLVSCGGYVAGDRDMISFLQHSCPGFVFSTGLPPANAAAALAALKIIDRSPELVLELREKRAYFHNKIAQTGLNIGTAGGSPVFPLYLEQNIAVSASRLLRSRNINVFPIIYPAVSQDAARLRFFLNRGHSHAQIDKAINQTVDVLEKIRSSNHTR